MKTLPRRPSSQSDLTRYHLKSILVGCCESVCFIDFSRSDFELRSSLARAKFEISSHKAYGTARGGAGGNPEAFLVAGLTRAALMRSPEAKGVTRVMTASPEADSHHVIKSAILGDGQRRKTKGTRASPLMSPSPLSVRSQSTKCIQPGTDSYHIQ